METGIEPIRYQTKYRKIVHQMLPSKKPLVAIIAELLRCYVRNEAKTLLYIHSAIFIDVVLCSLNQVKIWNSGFTFTWETNVRKVIEKKVKKESVKKKWEKRRMKKVRKESEKRKWRNRVREKSEKRKGGKKWEKIEKVKKKWENNWEKMMDE